MASEDPRDWHEVMSHSLSAGPPRRSADSSYIYCQHYVLSVLKFMGSLYLRAFYQSQSLTANG